MKNIVSYKTAQALKAAGFPQPEPEAGQFWYDKGFHRLCVIAYDCGKPEVTRICPLNCSDWSYWFHGEMGSGEHVFAPTAADILRELPATKGEHPIALCFFADGVDTFTVTDFHQGEDGLFSGCDISEHANPAEACAAAWLELKEQKEHNK